MIECLITTLEHLIHSTKETLSKKTMHRLVNGLYVLNSGMQERVQEVVARVHFRFIALLSTLVSRMHREKRESLLFRLGKECIKKWAIQITLMQPGLFRYNQFLMELTRLSQEGLLFDTTYSLLDNDLRETLCYQCYLYSGQLSVQKDAFLSLLS